ncbi:hypothetical protein KC669_04370 [Candidatus Dojkabacteria bacterium]|uniref:Uncharacterized protein n=1 Tax=Candidatus Dojkabacteria bacterium TaxID=2099670 RepID=A0A955LBP1_9BACT|nr:hypothetical protein [Candidatus Dojkabacteria bacterium]
MHLTNKQLQVYEWLKDKLNLPVFAEAYMGAIIQLSEKSAGHISFVSHAGRDLMNILARTVAGITTKQINYVDHVNSIQIYWKDEWNSDGNISQVENSSGHMIPYEICDRICLLIKEHEAAKNRNSGADLLFFSLFLDYSDLEKIPKNFIEDWKTTKRWFQKHTHLRMNHFKPTTMQELPQHFQCLDGFLFVAASSHYERLKELDEILDTANR